VLPEIAVAKVREDAPFDKICYIGCGVTTGIGAVMNTARVEPGSNCVVFGLGGIGLNVVQGLRLADANQIIGVDFNPARKEMAEKFGRTDFVNPKEVEGDLVPYLVNLTRGGADYTFDATGNVDVMRTALECAHKGWGESIIIRVAISAPAVAARPLAGLARHRVRRRARPHRCAEDRRLVYAGQDRDRPADHPHHAAGRHQQGVRSDAFGAKHSRRGDLLSSQMMHTLSENACFGGVQGVYSHASRVCACDMTFAVYLPPQARSRKVPVLWYLSGLTCTHENAMTKAGLQGFAARRGLALVFPDTSPRGPGVADDDAYDLGQGAGFYLNATEAPWAAHFKMQDYILSELRELLLDRFAVRDAHGVTGHSMGGHGALTLAMTHPDMFASLSAFAPIANPTRSDWGRKQLTAYLGDDDSAWAAHDATLLLRDRGWPRDILVDQGTDDQFLDLVRPEALAEALAATRTASEMRMQPGYDHSYFFVATFAGDHVDWHADRLSAQ